MLRLDRRNVLVGAGMILACGAPAAAKTRPPPSIMPAQRHWAPPPPLSGKELLASLPSVRLWCSDTGGSGPAMVLLHPGTGSGRIWGYQQAAFAAAGFRVIAYSRRGFAGSDAGPPDATGSAVDDLVALLDQLRVSRCHLVGSAAGGFIVPDFALSHPERLITATVACSQGGVVEADHRARIAALTAPGRNTPPSYRELGPSYRAANPQGVALWEALEHASLSGDKRVAQEPRNRIGWAELARIKTPMLFIAGAADGLAPPPLVLEVADHVTDAETGILSECGHSGYWEQPEGFNTLVLDFVRRRGPR